MAIRQMKSPRMKEESHSNTGPGQRKPVPDRCWSHHVALLHLIYALKQVIRSWSKWGNSIITIMYAGDGDRQTKDCHTTCAGVNQALNHTVVSFCFQMWSTLRDGVLGSLGLVFFSDIASLDLFLLLSGFWLPGRAKHVSRPSTV